MNKKVLLIEDEVDLQTLMIGQMKRLGLEIEVASSGEQALEIIQRSGRDFDLVILDWMLPGVSGIEICRFIRLYRTTRHLPILMVTALTEPERVIEGLDAGADDYLGKPYDPMILEARVRALLRRSQKNPLNKELGETETPPEKILHLGAISLDTESCKVKNADVEIALTLSEFRLLQAMLEHPGKVLTRKQLMEMVQGGQVHVTARTIDTHIFGLRKKIGDDAKYIETIRGIGYRVIIESENA